MNKQLIKIYFEEFNYWLNGGKLLYKSKDLDVWFGIGEAVWGLSTSDVRTIIINDEYVEFRKALAEGKIIQQQDYYSKEWIDMKTDKFHGASDTQYEGIYRIKPDEPQFKVGDWVIDKRHKHKPFQVTYKDLEPDSPQYIIQDCELWQPQPGEWCWNSIFGLVKVLCESKAEGHFICWNPWKKVDQTITIYEPFIGTLPTIIKDVV